MRKLILAAASLMITLPAFAQNATGPQSQQNPSTYSPQAQDSQTQTQTQTQNSQMTSKIAQQIRSNLEQAGFKNIKMMPSSFIVRAEDQNDNPVMMVINPDSITTVSKMRSGSSSSNTGDNATVGQNPGAGSNPDNNANNPSGAGRPAR